MMGHHLNADTALEQLPVIRDVTGLGLHSIAQQVIECTFLISFLLVHNVVGGVGETHGGG